MEGDIRRAGGARKRQQVRLCAAILAALAFTACTTPIGPGEAAPATSVIGGALGRPSTGSGVLTIRRDSGFLGGACGHLVRLDGKLVGELQAGQEVTVYPAPGEHVLEVRFAGMFCDASRGGGTAVQVEPGKRQVYRTGMVGFDFVLQQVGDK